MVRAQIQLTEEQYDELKRWSARLGISLSEAVRRCVSDHLMSLRGDSSREVLVREALAVVGKYIDPTGPSTVARDHDQHLAEAYEG